MGDIYPQQGGQPFGAPDGAPADDPLKAEAQAAKEKLGGAVEAVKGEAANFADSAKEKVAEKADQGKEAVTGALGDFAEAIRVAGEQLGEKDQTMAARLVSQAAEGLESLSRSVSEKRPEDMLNSIRDFGRNNPTAFMAGAVLAGIALGRFVRSSGEHLSTDGATASSSEAAQSRADGAERQFAESEGFVGNDMQSTSTTGERDPMTTSPHSDLHGSALGATDPAASDFSSGELGSSESGVSVLGEDDETPASRAPQTGI
jgi:hypothetical protein